MFQLNVDKTETMPSKDKAVYQSFNNISTDRRSNNFTETKGLTWRCHNEQVLTAVSARFLVREYRFKSWTDTYVCLRIFAIPRTQNIFLQTTLKCDKMWAFRNVRLCGMVDTAFHKIYFAGEKFRFQRNWKIPKSVKWNEYLIVHNKI